MRTFTLLCTSLLVAIAGAACDGGAQPATTSTTSSEPSVSTSVAPTAISIPPPAPAAGTPSNCQEAAGWGDGAKEANGSTTDALYLVRAEHRDCYDRVEFSINGPGATGFSVRYVPEVTADPSGAPLPVPGNAVLQVVIRAPAQGADDSGHQPGRVLARTGDYLYGPAQLSGGPSLLAVRFAGSFEGQCTFAVGIRDHLPFRASTVLDTVNQVRRVVVDIAR